MKKLFFIFCILPSLLLAKVGFNEPWDKDKALLKKTTNHSLPSLKSNAAKISTSIISFYQNVISPTNGPRSNFRPSSSRYMQLAIQRYGFLKGYIMGCDRLIRENDDKWIYRTIVVGNEKYKYDPAVIDKFSK